MMGDNDVTLAEQLGSATDADAVFCISCGQPDVPALHDPARCAGSGGTNDRFTVAQALEVFDESCSQEPDLDDHARALHCAMVAMEMFAAGPKVGGGSGDAALAIGEHAFRAGYAAKERDVIDNDGRGTTVDAAWNAYDPPEDIKALS